jgi:hypothetical protein
MIAGRPGTAQSRFAAIWHGPTSATPGNQPGDDSRTCNRLAGIPIADLAVWLAPERGILAARELSGWEVCVLWVRAVVAIGTARARDLPPGRSGPPQIQGLDPRSFGLVSQEQRSATPGQARAAAGPGGPGAPGAVRPVGAPGAGSMANRCTGQGGFTAHGTSPRQQHEHRQPRNNQPQQTQRPNRATCGNPVHGHGASLRAATIGTRTRRSLMLATKLRPLRTK